MKKSCCLLFLLLMCIVSTARSQNESTDAEPVVLHGVVTYADNWDVDGYGYGVYSFPATADTEFELELKDGDLFGNGGAVYVDGKLYIVSYMDFFGMLMASYIIYDVETKDYSLDLIDGFDLGDVAACSAYDVSTGNVYCCTIDRDDNTLTNLSTMNLETAKQTRVAVMPRMYALSATRKGELYGIAADGYLYQIDKYTAAATKVGDTGVKPSSNQSAFIDYYTGIMYWSAYTAESEGALYTVDLSTGQATLVTEYPNNEQVVGLYIAQQLQADGAPASAENLSVEFDKASLSGTVEFDMPALDVNETELLSELSYLLSVQGNVMGSGTAETGGHMTLDVTLDEEGAYQFVVNVSNEAGDAIPVSVSKFVGMDTPLKVLDPTLVNEDGETTLTYECQPVGVNGGYVDVEQVRYRIESRPDGTVLEPEYEGTTFTRQEDVDGMAVRFYYVTPFIGEKVGETVYSNYVVLGDHLTVPFVEDMTDWTRLLLYNVIDANEDGCSWEYDSESESVRYLWPIDDHSDDWLITPDIYLEAGKSYKAIVSARSEGDEIWAGYLSMSIGRGREVADMTREVMAPQDIVHQEFSDFSSEGFSVDESGIYNLGIYISGERSIWYAYIDRIEISETEGVMAVMDADASLDVSARNGVLYVSNPVGNRVEVYAMDGRRVLDSSESSISVSLERGVYVVAAEGKSVKVAL